MRIFRLIATFILIVFSSGNITRAVSQDTPEDSYKLFVSNQYDRKVFSVNKLEIHHGKALIQVIQVRRLKNFTDSSSPNGCRAWLKITTGSQTTFSRYFDDIEGLGFYDGIVVPNENVQPSQHWEIVLKNGDYDGRLYLVAKDGRTLDYPAGGSFYFLSPNRRFLFSEHALDYTALTVIDLKTGRLVFDGKALPPSPFYKPYTDGKMVYYTIEKPSEEDPNGTEPEKQGVIYRYESSKRIFEKMSVNKNSIQGLKEIPYLFDLKTQPEALQYCAQGTPIP